MSLRCVYVDIDGTLVGPGGSLFADAEGGFTMLGARGIEACHRAGAEIVVFTGRREAQAKEDVRLIGGTAYIAEVGCLLVVDGERTLFTGDLMPGRNGTVHEQIERAGAPRLLLDTYPGRLEYHDPWHGDRHFSHLFRGLVDADEATALLEREGHPGLKLVDNGAVARPRPTLRIEGKPHTYHLIPRPAGKAVAVAAHMRQRGYRPDECLAVGDSREDMEVADIVGRFFLVANAITRDPTVGGDVARRPNVQVTEEPVGPGFYEAVLRTLTEMRPVA